MVMSRNSIAEKKEVSKSQIPTPYPQKTKQTVRNRLFMPAASYLILKKMRMSVYCCEIVLRLEMLDHRDLRRAAVFLGLLKRDLVYCYHCQMLHDYYYGNYFRDVMCLAY